MPSRSGRGVAWEGLGRYSLARRCCASRNGRCRDRRGWWGLYEGHQTLYEPLTNGVRVIYVLKEIDEVGSRSFERPRDILERAVVELDESASCVDKYRTLKCAVREYTIIQGNALPWGEGLADKSSSHAQRL